jgi:hypothetical protein
VSTKTEPSRPASRYRLHDPRVRLGAIVGVAAVVGAVLGVTLSHSGGSSSPSTTVKPIRVSAAGLRMLARYLTAPIYWAGPISGRVFELRRAADGSVTVRYLPRSAQVGTKDPYLAIATYPLANAYEITREAASKQGAVRVGAGAGLVAFYNRSKPTNVYLARPGSNYQVEVFDPSQGRARTLVQSGRVAPIPGKATLAIPHAVSVRGLTTLESSLGHPIYWLGPKKGFTYELVQTGDGKIYLRYLPAGVTPGDPKPYLTVATYPFKNAYAALKALPKQAGTTLIMVPGGAVALLNTKSPTDVHLAFPGSNYQIEVFDPAAGKAQAAVASGKVNAVR